MSPKSNFHRLLENFICQIIHRNLHQGLVGICGIALFTLPSKWTSNVQELLTLRGDVGTGT